MWWEKMGTAKLNIWFRDLKCRPFYNLWDNPGYDWVEIYNCLGERIAHVHTPVNEAHVVVEVPPGCYMITGWVCEHRPRMHLNGPTERAMVIVGCDQEVCVNLIVPTIDACTRNLVNAMVTEAQALDIPGDEIAVTVRTLLAAARVSKLEMMNEIERHIDMIKEIKGSHQIVGQFKATLDFIKAEPIVKLPVKRD